MIVRRAQEKDIPAILDLLSQVLEIHAKIRPDLFISGTRKYTEEELREILRDDARPVFTACDDADEVCGYAFCVMEDTEGSNNLVPMKSLYIDDLCVDENKRGMHIGRILYDYVMDFAKEQGCSAVTLNVWEGNDSARAFYDKMGFFVRKTVLEKKI